jgi:hypothetical protein
VGTVRIGPLQKSSPATSFWLEADWVAQSGNSSCLRVWLRSANGPGGSTGSSFGGYGIQEAHADHKGRVGWHEGNPFLPSGYPNGATRWHDHVADVWYEHDANGYLYNVGLAMVVRYGNVNETHYGSIGAPGRIPKPPTAPRDLRAVDITPNSAAVTYAAPADFRGSSFIRYIADWYEINGSNNPLVWKDLGSNGYTSPQGGAVPGAPALKPATTYHVYIAAETNYGVGAWSSIALTTKSAFYVGKGGGFPAAAGVFVGKGGAFPALPELRVGRGGSFVTPG